MANEKPKVKKVAVKTVISQTQRDINEAMETKGLIAKVLSNIEKEWIPEVESVYKKAKALQKKALDISVNDENGMMDVEVTSDEGENVSVQDNTNGGGDMGDTGAPVEDAGMDVPPADVTSDDDFQKTFKFMQDSMKKIEKYMTGKNKANNKK